MILSVDPGDTTGCVLWEDDGTYVEHKQLDFDTFDTYLDTLVLERIVYEDFILFRKRAQAQVGSRFVASQVIGVLKSHARRYGVELVRQPSNILGITELHTGMKMPTQHKKSHWVAAWLHGFYYFEQQGILESRPADARNRGQAATEADRVSGTL